MKIVPNNYETSNVLGLTSNELALVNRLTKFNLNSTVLLKLQPVNNVKLDFCLIDNQIGLVLIITVSPNVDNYEQIVNVYKNIIIKQYISQIETKLSSFRTLYEGGIKFPIGILFYFQGTNKDSFPTSNFVDNYFLFENDFNKWSNDDDLKGKLKKSILNEFSHFQGFTDAQLENIKLAICPEYTIPKFIEVDDSFDNSNMYKEFKLQKNRKLDRQLKTLDLTEDQINMVNGIEYGHELLLAGAGSGKTVLLTARAFRVAKAFPDKNILITCYNAPLSESVNLFINTSGMRLRNLKNRTFHGLLIDLLETNGIPCHRTGDDTYFDKLFETAQKALDEGKIKDKFYGIFIDEIQDFKPEWYRFLTKLIENKNEYFINICGDKTQDIRGIINESGEPWKEVKGINFDGNKKILKTNFRYTTRLNNFIIAFGIGSKKDLKKYDINNFDDEELFIRSKTHFNEKGEYPVIYKVDKYDEEIHKVIECLNDLHYNKKIPLSEIAILYPNRKNDLKKYYPYHYLIKALEDNKISYTDLGDNISNYYDRTGVVISTIHKSKGLDFQAIILFGLNGLFPSKITRNSSTDIKNEYQKNMNLIYTAITRPSKYLSVVNLDREDNPYIKLIDDTPVMIQKLNKIRKIKKRSEN
ncbi:3'-5' exonuclease [Ureibacillus acetophenoni]|uniref:AAA domain-containing protein n=1 Tax=Ureibacillus acetophenoni TaxID=614649 RepID=A0A285UHQ8_9BACL|nr:3'-5' exonuclease [Ureibacillus acetophenoni]SOC41454.1 AAA domain-containing protein [Ureibacillus acetophenoni]